MRKQKKKTPNRKHSDPVYFRVTPECKTALLKVCDDTGHTLSDLMRDAAQTLITESCMLGSFITGLRDSASSE